MKDLIKTAFLAILALLLIPVIVQGTTLTLKLDTEFSGATQPEGAAPWITATFDDSFGDNKTVRLTMSTGNLVNQEFVTDWYFNFDPALNPIWLTPNRVDNTTTGPIGMQTGTNTFKADGDGFFDILFAFPQFQDPKSQDDNRFAAGVTIIYDLTYTDPFDPAETINVSSFDFGSTPGAGKGQITYKSAAHIQGIGTNDDSGWIAGGVIPEPSTIILLGVGLLGLAGITVRRKMNK